MDPGFTGRGGPQYSCHHHMDPGFTGRGGSPHSWLAAFTMIFSEF